MGTKDNFGFKVKYADLGLIVFDILIVLTFLLLCLFIDWDYDYKSLWFYPFVSVCEVSDFLYFCPIELKLSLLKLILSDPLEEYYLF